MAPLARFLCLAAAVGGLLAASACQTSRIKVEMVASGDNANYGAIYANKISVNCP